MSAAAAVPTFGACWTKSPIDRETWKRSARRAWDWLKHPRRQRKREHTPTNREMANELGCSRRTVQRGLQGLEGIGAAFRDFSEGVRKIIVRPLAGEGKEEEEGQEKSEAPPKPTAPRATKPPPVPAPPPQPEPPPSPEEQRQASAALRAEMARISAEAEAEKRASKAEASSSGPAVPPPPKPIKGINPDDRAYLEFKEGMGELTPSERARLDAIRGNRSP